MQAKDAIREVPGQNDDWGAAVPLGDCAIREDLPVQRERICALKLHLPLAFPTHDNAARARLRCRIRRRSQGVHELSENVGRNGAQLAECIPVFALQAEPSCRLDDVFHALLHP